MDVKFSPLGFCKTFLLSQDQGTPTSTFFRIFDMGNGAYLHVKSQFGWNKNCRLLYAEGMQRHLSLRVLCADTAVSFGACPKIDGPQATCHCLRMGVFICEPMLADANGYLKAAKPDIFGNAFASGAEALTCGALCSALGAVYALPEMAGGLRMGRDFACPEVTSFEPLRAKLDLPVKNDARYAPPPKTGYRTFPVIPHGDLS